MFVKKYANRFMNKRMKQMGKIKAGHVSREKTKQLLNSRTLKKRKRNPGNLSSFLDSVTATDLLGIGI